MRNIRRSTLAATVLTLALMPYPGGTPAHAQTEVQEEPQSKKEKRRAKKGARTGALVGGALGLAMGAATGDAGIAAAGAVAGAAAGAGAGAMYEYDQGKQDDRTQMLADAIASKDSGGGAPADVQPKETVGDVGARHLKDLHGSWKMDIWVLGAEGKRVQATGLAQGIAAGDAGTRLILRDIKTEGFDEVLSGYALLTYDPGQGFFMESSFSNSAAPLNAVGEYLVDKNTYVFYLTTGEGEEMVSGGIIRSGARMEVRIASPAMFIADTYTLIDGEEVQVQSYRFTKAG